MLQYNNMYSSNATVRLSRYKHETLVCKIWCPYTSSASNFHPQGDDALYKKPWTRATKEGEIQHWSENILDIFEREKYFWITVTFSTAHCVLCKVYFSVQPNKLRPILKFKKYYPIEHIFVPACSSARKIHFFKF